MRVLVVEDDPKSACYVRGSLAEIENDAGLTGQAVANLVENALRRTPMGALIKVVVTRLEDRAAVMVSDDGPGLSRASLTPARLADGGALRLRAMA